MLYSFFLVQSLWNLECIRNLEYVSIYTSNISIAQYTTILDSTVLDPKLPEDKNPVFFRCYHLRT